MFSEVNGRYFESKNFAAHAPGARPNLPIFRIGLIKIYLIGSIVPIYKIAKKFYTGITPPYSSGQPYFGIFPNLTVARGLIIYFRKLEGLY